ncbi:unnamed protein product [Hymenolepis diminuta]|uniref:Uncharacterized protein n=1 Tax=Hymenolepis diminuta TaxID=6216 RepID=A0A564YWN1_HYMDI|nr:unnamed protein product [Hymenolepis diminuta]
MSSKNLEDYMKNVDILHHNPLIGETFVTWYPRYRDFYKEQRCRTFSHHPNYHAVRSDHDLYSSYLIPMDHVDQTYEKRLVSYS